VERKNYSRVDFEKGNTGGISRKWFRVLGIIAIVLIVASLIMAIFIQNIITTAREDGSDKGEAQGYSDGYEEGRTVGYETGSEEGYGEGDAEGYEEGLEEGYEEGKGEGYSQGFASGHEESLPIGYEAGEKEGYPSGDKAGYESGMEEGYTDGYASGFEDGTGTDYLVRNPTYNEVLDMLDESEATSAEQINNDFEAEGIRAGYVWASIAEGGGYILAAFETIDRGLIFIRASSDEEVELEIGKRYSELLGYSVPDFDDTITKVTIVW